MRWLRDNGLTLALMAMFMASLSGMFFSGWSVENQELEAHGRMPITLLDYLFDPSFQSAVFENWESEFLQMAAYVTLTAMLFQRGSAESRDPDNPDEENREEISASSPWPVLAGGLWKALYSYSLGAILALLFILSFVLHWLNSLAAANEDALQHGLPTQSPFGYLFDAQLWFESFQNWQSEFLSTAVLVVLSIFLRYRGSPESKAIGEPNSKTGQ